MQRLPPGILPAPPRAPEQVRRRNLRVRSDQRQPPGGVRQVRLRRVHDRVLGQQAVAGGQGSEVDVQTEEGGEGEHAAGVPIRSSRGEQLPQVCDAALLFPNHRSHAREPEGARDRRATQDDHAPSVQRHTVGGPSAVGVGRDCEPDESVLGRVVDGAPGAYRGAARTGGSRPRAASRPHAAPVY